MSVVQEIGVGIGKFRKPKTGIFSLRWKKEKIIQRMCFERNVIIKNIRNMERILLEIMRNAIKTDITWCKKISKT